MSVIFNDTEVGNDTTKKFPRTGREAFPPAHDSGLEGPWKPDEESRWGRVWLWACYALSIAIAIFAIVNFYRFLRGLK
jgi:hypothetical protein